MPHICTRCNNVFQSGEDILKGCPVCGWKKFMFARTGSAGTEGDNPSSQQVITKAMGVRVPPGRRAKKEATKEEIAKEKIETIGKKVSEKPYSPATKNSLAIKRPEEPGAEGDKLESIKITAPGTYELNLPSLFEREELIMAVKEGTYFIDLSSAFRKGKKE
jgi:predicted  nucleic acid-binding Zn-ribbon protein